MDACGEKITLIAKTNPAVAAATEAKLEEGFSFNKDAKMLQCQVGELAMRVEKRKAKSGNQYRNYVFSYRITQASEKNRSRLEFEASEKFQERLKIRHQIEEKNGELKKAHGLGRADSVGLFAMELQMYFTAFAANIKRITKLIALDDKMDSIFQ